MNLKEQMFTEKLRSLLKFGSFSRRYKDIFDLYYLSDKMDTVKLLKCLEVYVFMDSGMKENNMEDIINRVSTTFKNRTYQGKLKSSRRNWLDKEIEEILEELIIFLEDIKKNSTVVM